MCNNERRCWGWGGGALTLRQSDLRVKTTGRKSHDPFKLIHSEGEGVAKRRQTGREAESWGKGGKGRNLFFSLLFFSV